MRKNFIRSAVTAVLVTLAAALVFAAAVCLTACDGSDVDTPPAADGNAYLVIESGADDMYSVYSLDAGGLGNVFDMLDAADVKYATAGSGDMRMIVSVGGADSRRQRVHMPLHERGKGFRRFAVRDDARLVRHDARQQRVRRGVDDGGSRLHGVYRAGGL